jgi:co-chaperonin GroES (HSP10)
MTTTEVANLAEQQLKSELEQAFPEVDPGCKPYGSRLLVQIRSPKRHTAGGIIVPNESRDTELWNTQVAKVIAIGPLAFKNRETLEPWPEGNWCEPGTFIRVPKYGGDRWEVAIDPSKPQGEKALFVIFPDLDIVGEYTGNPLDVVAFL